MTYEEAVKSILPGRYRHFKGNEYEVIGIARHSEDESPMVVYRALYGEGGLWCRPASMWNEIVERDEATVSRDPEKLRLLDEYYTSGEWREDYEADERGELPPNMKRRVLSQDALYDLLWERKL